MTLPPNALIDAIVRALPGSAGADWIALPGGRTNLVWRVGAVVVKLYRREAASPLFPNDPAAEVLMLDHLSATGLAPRLVCHGHASGQDYVVYSHADGRAWSEGAEDAGRLLARVHARMAPPGLRMAPVGSGAILAQTRLILAQAGQQMQVPPDPGLGPPSRLALIHGDAVAGNLIRGEAGLTLIDWQCPAMGDPVDDLAAFLSPAMQWLYLGRRLSPNERHAFLAACPDQDCAGRYLALAPILHARLKAHCLWKAAQGDLAYAHAATLEDDHALT